MAGQLKTSNSHFDVLKIDNVQIQKWISPCKKYSMVMIKHGIDSKSEYSMAEYLIP